MSLQAASLVAYTLVFVALWLPLELLGLARRRGGRWERIPWYTNSETVWALERAFWPLRLLVLAGGFDLTIHLAFGTPLW